MKTMDSYKTMDEIALKDFNDLFEECRDTCLWFWNRKVMPKTVADKREALRQIELHGNVQQFKRARELEQWL